MAGEQTIAQRVRAKFPGTYDDLDDQQLETAVLAKHPEYKDLPRTSAAPKGPPATTPQAKRWAERLGNAMGVPAEAFPAVDALEGAVGRAAQTVFQGGDAIRRGLGMERVVNTPETQQAMHVPDTIGGKVGSVAESVAESFAPSGLVSKAQAALSTGKGILGALVNAGVEGAAQAGMNTIHEGSTEHAGTVGAVTAGAGVGMRAGLTGLGWLGQRIESALVKPSATDIKNGFSVGNIFKYKLGGSISDTYDKSIAKIKELTGDLQGILRSKPGAEVDALGALAETGVDLQRSAAKTFGSNAQLQASLSKLLEDPLFATAAKSGKVDLVTAQQMKQAVGDLGAWAHGARDPEARGMEIVANALYTKLAKAIESASGQAGPDVALINKQLSEVIPVAHAIVRRIPVEQRANVMNLGDLIGTATGNWGLALANRLLKSGQAAQLFDAASQSAPQITAPASRVVAGATSQALGQ